MISILSLPPFSLWIDRSVFHIDEIKNEKKKKEPARLSYNSILPSLDLIALSFGGTSRAGSRVALPSRIGSKSISLEPFSLSTPEELRDLIITKFVNAHIRINRSISLFFLKFSF